MALTDTTAVRNPRVTLCHSLMIAVRCTDSFMFSCPIMLDVSPASRREIRTLVWYVHYFALIATDHSTYWPLLSLHRKPLGEHTAEDINRLEVLLKGQGETEGGHAATLIACSNATRTQLTSTSIHRRRCEALQRAGKDLEIAALHELRCSNLIMASAFAPFAFPSAALLPQEEVPGKRDQPEHHLSPRHHSYSLPHHRR